MVSNSKLVENLIYIDGYMTPVSNEYDYEEIQKIIQRDLAEHGWSNVTVYVVEVEPGFRDINLRRNLMTNRGKTVRVSIYSGTKN